MKLMVLQFAEHEGPGTLNEWASQMGIELEVVHLYKSVEVPSPADFNGVIALGGPFTAYEADDDPVLKKAGELIEEVLDKDIPYYGICLGGQLLAAALEAPVRRNPVREIGFYEIELTEDGLKNPIFRGIPAQFTTFEWHDDTFDIPVGCLHLATSELCDNQAFSHKNRQFAVQFDMQVTPEMIANWLQVERDWVHDGSQPVDERQILRQAKEFSAILRNQSFRLFSNFLAVISRG